MSLNKVFLIGNLTKDPEARKTGGGTSVCGFDIAVNRRFKGANGEPKDEVTFVSCEAWGKTADNVCEYKLLRKTEGRRPEVKPRLSAYFSARKLALAAQDAYTTGLLPSGCDLHRIARRIK